MDTNKMRDISREQFELRYPVPEGCCWNAEQGRYVLFHLKLCTVAKYERFVENWVCWQLSREDAVIQVPDMKDKRYWEQFEDVEGESFIYGRYIGHFIAAIEGQGLKVTP
ncbi:hypothetical protein [Pseudomonas sp. S32]|uniref:hypothetical protein n=1 Tax=Pseudomonas sp. S32 TaxID=2767448 RepID=UPI001913577C|nr:hypothetical protein [Pseudomonas sp. S32]MBK5004120.1 hypothetical protein [Pseudomonas sp. S32]